MAAFLFSRAILEGQPIQLFNEGRMKRDFTYVEDVVEGILRVLKKVPQPDPNWKSDAPDPASSNAPYRLYNIGHNDPVELLRFVEILETELGRKALKELLPMQPGDVPATYADIDDLTRDVDFRPATPIADGISRFIEWYRSYHHL
jgi:UDP-glucuronate 4-epimerase